MTESAETAVVIGGGVGPMAGVALHARIVLETLTDGTDQSHLTVLHLSRSVAVPDRTRYILSLGGGGPETVNPALGMADVFDMAARALPPRADAVGGVPCNTFHAPAIFDRFLAEMERRRNPVRVVNMLEETLGLLSERLSGAEGSGRIGVMSTTGTRRSGVYDAVLARAGWRAVYVDEDDQEELHRVIYDPEWGIKAVSPPGDRARSTLRRLAEGLLNKGVSAILPACTELPLAMPGEWLGGVPLVDPVTALARAMVREAAPGKLRPLAIGPPRG